MGVDGSVGWFFGGAFSSAFDIDDEIKILLDDGYDLRYYNIFSYALNYGKLVGLLPENQLNKMIKLYLIYLILEYIWVPGLEKVLVYPLVAGYGFLLVVKLKVLMINNLD